MGFPCKVKFPKCWSDLLWLVLLTEIWKSVFWWFLWMDLYVWKCHVWSIAVQCYLLPGCISGILKYRDDWWRWVEADADSGRCRHSCTEELCSPGHSMCSISTHIGSCCCCRSQSFNVKNMRGQSVSQLMSNKLDRTPNGTNGFSILRPPQGSVKLIFTKLVDLAPLE